MTTYTISKLARLFGLSRSTLLYYDRLGLLTPSGRTPSGYRTYTEADRERLERICAFRQAGLPLEAIGSIVSSGGTPSATLLEHRLREIGEEILHLKAQQSLLTSMLKQMTATGAPTQVDKAMWVEMLRAAGMDEQAMVCWHAEFEERAPEAHHEFLRSLGISEEEAQAIRSYSRQAKRTPLGLSENSGCT